MAPGTQMDGQGVTEEEGIRLSLRLHTEDIVCLEGSPGQIGVVARVHEEDEDSEDEADEEDEEEVLQPGQVEVCWIEQPGSSPDGDQEDQEIIDSSKLTLIDRSLMHGDVVGSSANPLGQSGTIVDVDLSVDLRLVDGKIVQDVSAKRLRQIRRFNVGCYVLYQQWLGRIEEVLDDLVLCFEDGGVCEVKDVAYAVLAPENLSATDDETLCPYWPGQVVRAFNPNVTFRSARWHHGSWSANKQLATVKEVKPGSVSLSWRSCVKMPSGNGDLINPPPDTISGALLTPLTYFAYTHFQLGDRCLPPQDLLTDPEAAADEEAPNQDGATEGQSRDRIAPPIATSSNEAASSSQPPPQEADHVPSAEGKGRKRAQKRAQQRERRRAKNQKNSIVKEKAKVEPAAMIVNTRTTVDVLWQDGTKSNVKGADLFPMEDLGDYDFWPEEYVLEREPSEDGRERQCLVRSVNAKERTAVVRWLEGELEFEQEPRFGPEEVVSVYELAEHPDYDYRLGDVVTRLPGAKRGTIDGIKTLAGASIATQLEYVGEIVGLREGLITVAWADGLVSEVGPQNILVASGDDDDDDDDESFYDDSDNDDASWETFSAEGSEQEAAPQEDPASEVLERWQQAEATFAALNGAGPLTGTTRFGEEALWTDADFPPLISDVQNFNNGQPTSASGTSSQAAQQLEFSSAAPGPLTSPLRFLGRVMARTGGWLRSGTETEEGGRESEPASGASSEALAEEGEVSERGESQETAAGADESARQESEREGENAEIREQVVSPVEASRSLEPAREETTLGSGEAMPQEAASSKRALENASDVSTSGKRESGLSLRQEAAIRKAGEQLRGMKHFELMATAPEDHKFLDQVGQATNPRRWSKRIQTEWAALEASLPDSIYVQVFEGRMDLLRAVIVGATGTPYHDNLFFFDFYFPPDFPSSPPVAHYHSGGLRVNPNLYESGKVCLSLLNTWNGKGTELWDSTSSMLQVLISLQGLVLVAKPYFNEAGYERQMGTIEGEKNSLVYNESAFLLVCKSLQYLIKRPPKGFEELVQYFYQHRAPALLGALSSYLSGKRVGSLPDWDEIVSTGEDSQDTAERPGSTPESEEASAPIEKKDDKTVEASGAVEKSLGNGGCSFGFRIALEKVAPKLRTQLVELLGKEAS